MVVSEKKWKALYEEMSRLGLKEENFSENFILGSSSGGQKINKTHSCVVLKHLPTGIEVKCQKTRSREDNRFFARRSLCEKYATLHLGEKTKKSFTDEKIRKQKKRRTRRKKSKPTD